MERSTAIQKLYELKGQVLQDLAPQYGVTINTSKGTTNKGWAGHLCEEYLGLPINSSQKPDFGDWELKSISVKTIKNGEQRFKETMCITMIDPTDVVNTPFEQSHLLSKLRSLVVVARTYGKTNSDPSEFMSATSFDLTDTLYEDVKADYELVQNTIKNKGFLALSGTMGKYIQPRTKGAKNSKTRAFYARPLFLQQFIDIN